MTYLLVKWLHVLSSTVLFGTGLGSAFYMFFASRTRNHAAIAVVVRYVVIADWLFTTPTIILQPLTGFYLMHLAGFPMTSAWIVWSVRALPARRGRWLPVVWMQIQMRDMATPRPIRAARCRPRYWQFLRCWVALGIVAFVALVVVFYLMVAKPAL